MQTIILSMITLLTTVVMMPMSAWAANDNDKPSITYEQASAECDGQGKKAGHPERSNCLSSLLHGNKEGATDSQCQEAKKAMAEPLKAYAAACGAFNLSMGKNCEEKVKSCDENLSEYGEEEEDFKSGTKKEVESDKYDACPIPAIKDAKLAKDKVDKLEKDIEALDDKVESAQEKVQKAQANIDTKEAERLTANNKLKEAYEQELEDKGLASKKELEETKKEIEAIEKGIRELEQGKNDQDVQYAVDLAKIEGICEAAAEKALEEQVKAQVEKVNKNQLTKRNLQAQLTLKSEGRTSQNSEFRKNEIARCRATYEERWKKPVELLKLNYQNTRLKIENAIKDLLSKRTQTYSKLSSELPQKQQEEAQKLSQKFQAKSEAVKAEFDKEIGQCGNFSPTMANGKTNQTTVPNGCTGLQKQMAEEVAAKANLEAKRDDLKSDLDYYTQLLRLASSKLKNVDSTTDVDLQGSASSYASAADNFATLCENDGALAAEALKVKGYLDNMGRPITTKLESPPEDKEGTDGNAATGAAATPSASKPAPEKKAPAAKTKAGK